MSVFNQIKNIFRNTASEKEEIFDLLNDQEKLALQNITMNEECNHTKKNEWSLPCNAPFSKNYILLERLGAGAFSHVYKAIDKVTGQRVAIKIVRKHGLDQLKRNSVLKEAQIMQTNNHPFIVKLLKFQETKDFIFLVLELMNGGEIFHQIVRLTYFSEDLARHCIQQVAEAVRYLHEERGIVHRDIKPENILFDTISFLTDKGTSELSAPAPTMMTARTEEVKTIKKSTNEVNKLEEGKFVLGIGGGGIGRVKLADFGLSKVIWNDVTMTPCGTVGYTAPEILRDEHYSKPVDMWALGCVLYTMLCGFPPFYDDNVPALTRKVASGRYTFLSPWWDPISADAKNLVSHLLETDPRKRFTIRQLLNHPWMKKETISLHYQPRILDDSDTIVAKVNKQAKEQQERKDIILEEDKCTTKRRSADSLLSNPDTTPSIANDITTTSATSSLCFTSPPPPSSPKDIPGSSYHYRSQLPEDPFMPGSPGVTMREAFQIAYDMHRIGEERAQRKGRSRRSEQSAINIEVFTTFSTDSHDDLFDDNDPSYYRSISKDYINQNTFYLTDNLFAEVLNTTDAEKVSTKKSSKNRLIRTLAAGKDHTAQMVNRTIKATATTFDLDLKSATLLGRRKNSSSIT